MTKRSKIVAFAALAVPAAVLAYGYWFGVTHGSLYIGVDDVTDREHPQRVAAIEMSLLDAAGQTLAEARSSPPYGTISIVAPELYDCHAFEGPGPASSDAQQQWGVLRTAIALAADVDPEHEGRQAPRRLLRDRSAADRRVRASRYLVVVVGAAPAYRRQTVHELRREHRPRPGQLSIH